MTGATLVECDPEGMDEALAGDIACVLYPVHLEGRQGTLSLAETAERAHARGVPVVVDAAYMSYPTDLIATYGAQGADLTMFSAKYFWGPNAGGFVYGNARARRRRCPDRLHALRVGPAPDLRPRVQDGPERRRRHRARTRGVARDGSRRALGVVPARAERLAAELGTSASVAQFTLDERLVDEAPNSLVVDAGGREEELAAELMAGSPSIVCVPMDGKLVFCLETVAEEDDSALLDRIRSVLA